MSDPLRDLLDSPDARTAARSAIGLITIGGRTPGLALATTDPAYIAASVHLRWQIDGRWGLPPKGFAVYRRPHEKFRDHGRRKQDLPDGVMFRLERVWWQLRSRLGGAEALAHPSALSLREPARELELVFDVPLGPVTLQGWDRNRRTLDTHLPDVQAGVGYRVATAGTTPAAVVDRIRLSAPLGLLRSLTYTPVAPDVPQWPDGDLASWGAPIRELALPSQSSAGEAGELLERHGTEMDRPSDLEGVLRGLLADARTVSTAPDLLALTSEVLDLVLRGRRVDRSGAESLRMRAVDQLALLATHPAMAEFLGFAWRDDLSGHNDHERFDYLVTARFSDELILGAAEYGVHPDTTWRLRPPTIIDAQLTEPSVPTSGGYRRTVRLDLRPAVGVVERERAPLVRLLRDGAPVSTGLALPITNGACWDQIGDAGRHHYQVTGADLFGRQAPAVTGVDLDVDASDLPAPPAPALVTAGWTPSNTYRVGWQWSPERRRLFPEVNRFQIAADGLDVGPEVPLAAPLPVTVTPAASPSVAGRLNAAPTVTALTEGTVVTLHTDLAVADTALTLFDAASPGLTFEVRRDGAWLRHEVIEHTVGPEAAFVVRADTDHPWPDHPADAQIRLTFDRPDISGVWQVDGGDGRPLTAGLLGDAGGTAFPILVAGHDSAVLILHRSTDGAGSAAPIAGAAIVTFPEYKELDAAVVPGPDLMVPARRPAFTVAALTADGRRGAASAPAVVTRVLADVPPTLAAPSTELRAIPDVHHRSRVSIRWALPAPEYRCEVLRIGEPQVRLVLAGTGDGIDLPALLGAGGDIALALHRAFEVVGSTPPGVTELDDVPTTTGVRLWYAVRALDGAGNRGAPSALSTPVLPPDVRPPTPPKTLRTRRDGDRIEVSWAVTSPDVDGYRVLRSAQARPASPMLLAVVTPGVAADLEPLRVHAGRAVLPGFEPGADTVERVLGGVPDGSADPARDLTPLVMLTAAGDALQRDWAEGLPVVVESMTADGRVRLHGLDDAPIVVTAGEVHLHAVPDGAEVTGVLPRHLVRLDAHGRPVDRAALPDLRGGGVLDPTARLLRSVEREGTRWLIELAAIENPTRRRFVDALENGGERPVELRDGVILLPYWDGAAELLQGLYCWSETVVDGDPPQRRPAPSAADRLDRFELDTNAWCLRPAWRDGVAVAIRYRRPDGTAAEHRVDPARRMLSDLGPPAAEARYYLVQARRTVGTAAVWSAMSEPVRHHEPTDRTRPVWVTVRWDDPLSEPRHLLAWRAPGGGVHRLFRRAESVRLWSVVVELEPVDGVVRARTAGGDWAAAPDWSITGCVLTGMVTGADSTVAWDYRIEWQPGNAEPPRASVAARIPAPFESDGA